MKKLLIVAAIAAFAVRGTSAADHEYYTDTVARVDRIIETRNFSDLNFHMVPKAELAAADARIAAAFSTITNGVDAFHCSRAPQTSRAAAATYADRCPGLVAWLDTAGYNRPWWGWNEGKGKDPALFINAIDGWFWTSASSKPIINYYPIVKVFKNRVLAAAQSGLKRYLRSQGVSFVAKEGVNPMQERMDALSAALDAPRFEGLSNACANVGITLTVNPSRWIPPASEIEQMKTDILNGDRNFDDREKVILTCALGVEAYNAFVKTYNGD